MIDLPPLGLGTWKLQGDACRKVVTAALQAGYRHVDTAQGYGNESEVGDAIRSSGVSRSSVVVTTKIWPDELQDDGLAAVERSLRRLGLDHVDLLLLHWPSPTRGPEAALPMLVQAQDRGLARAIGVGNYPLAALQRAVARAPICCNQVELHPYLAQRRVCDRMRALGVQPVAYSPLAQGRCAADPMLQRIGESCGRTAAQVALRWLVQRGIPAVPKAGATRHLLDNLAALSFELPESTMRSIDALDAGQRLLDPTFAPAWDPPY